jgi:hypothetical protein
MAQDDCGLCEYADEIKMSGNITFFVKHVNSGQVCCSIVTECYGKGK